MNSKIRLQKSRQYWDNEAATFDNEPDHGLRDPVVRKAWTQLLRDCLPSHPASILDIGCGTGSLSLVMAELGHDVTGIDLSEAMIVHAKEKTRAAGYPVAFPIDFIVMDAYEPVLPQRQFDAIICRHLLWTMPDPATALQRWSELLLLGGRMILVEGFWHTGGGLHAQQVVDALPKSSSNVAVESLSERDSLWGGPVTDERYIVVADF